MNSTDLFYLDIPEVPTKKDPLRQQTEMFWLLQLQFLELSGTALRAMFFDTPDMRYPQCIFKNQVTEHEKLATALAYHFAGVEE